MTKPLRAAAFLIQHGFVAAVNILVLAGLHWLLEHVGDIRMFGRVPLAYLFDAADLLIFAVFMIYGTIEAVSVLREGEISGDASENVVRGQTGPEQRASSGGTENAPRDD